MFLIKMKKAAVMAFAMAVLVLGGGMLIRQSLAAAIDPPTQQTRKTDEAPPPRAQGKEGPLPCAAALEGTWKILSLQARGKEHSYSEALKEGRLIITAEQIVHEIKAKAKATPLPLPAIRSFEKSYKLNVKKKPREIDLISTEGQKRSLGIFVLNGDKLTICEAAPGETRPSEFVTKPDSKQLLWVLQREPAGKDGENKRLPPDAKAGQKQQGKLTKESLNRFLPPEDLEGRIRRHRVSTFD